MWIGVTFINHKIKAKVLASDNYERLVQRVSFEMRWSLTFEATPLILKNRIKSIYLFKLWHRKQRILFPLSHLLNCWSNYSFSLLSCWELKKTKWWASSQWILKKIRKNLRKWKSCTQTGRGDSPKPKQAVLILTKKVTMDPRTRRRKKDNLNSLPISWETLMPLSLTSSTSYAI